MISEFAAKLPEAEATMSRLNFSGLLSNGKSDWAVVGEGGNGTGDAVARLTVPGADNLYEDVPCSV